jgi:hypothetical protein
VRPIEAGYSLGNDSADQTTDYGSGQNAATRRERTTSESTNRGTTNEPRHEIIPFGKALVEVVRVNLVF